MRFVIALFFVCESVWAQCPLSTVPCIDQFESQTLDECWSWVRENSSTWSLSENAGWLRLRTNGNFHQPQTNSTQSIPLRTFADGNIFIETKLDFSINNCAGAGLMFYKDDDNFVDIMLIEEAEPDLQAIVSHNDVQNAHAGRVAVFSDWHPVFLRILKSGNVYTASASQDSSNWILIGQWVNDLTVNGVIRAGLYAIDCDRNLYLPADFDYFRAENEENLPVELLSFSASPQDESVVLTWVTGSESEMSHFEIERDGEMVANVAATNRATGNSYQWRDENLQNGHEYAYQLSSVDLDGTREVVGQVTATPRANEIPSEFMLLQNYPNPFNASTTMEFVLPEVSEVTLTIYNLLGDEVAVVTEGVMSAGAHRVIFDAGELSSGIYFYRLQAGERMMQRKMAVVR